MALNEFRELMRQAQAQISIRDRVAHEAQVERDRLMVGFDKMMPEKDYNPAMEGQKSYVLLDEESKII